MNHRKKLYILLTTLFIFRCVMACFTELLPEEAYYWTYAQNLSLSYYDHPNMVANIICVFGIFGKSELTVRLGAIILSLLTSVVVFKSAKLLFDEEAAFWSVIILNATPLSAASSFLMTPDAPLFFFWVLTIYCIAKAIRAGNEGGRRENGERGTLSVSRDPFPVSRSSFRPSVLVTGYSLPCQTPGLPDSKTQRLKDSYWWYFAGLSMGAAWSSKYTASFLGISVLLYFLLSNKNRKWFLRKEPYIAILLAVIVFSPVILWNYRNDWASFKFQTVHRAEASPPLSLNLFLRFIEIQIAAVFPYWFPFIIYAAYKSTRRIISEWEDKFVFLMSFFLPMLLFFGASSFRQIIKLNWTSPAFFTAIIAAAAVFGGKFKRTFMVFTGISLILVVLTHFFIACPFFNLPVEKNFFGWNEFAEQIDRKIDAIARENAVPGSSPEIFILGCGNKYQMASEVNFYKKSLVPVVSVNAFGTSALEYDYITDPMEYIGWDAIIVYDKDKPPAHLNDKLTAFESYGPAREVPIAKCGKTVRTFVIMHCRKYKGPVFTDKEP